MPKEELTNNRPDNYSKWRRQQSINYCTDGDWFEQRFIDDKLTVVAYIETINIPDGKTPVDFPIWKSKNALIKDIAEKMQIPCFVVWHTSDCKLFFVQKLGNGKPLKMYEKDYEMFLRGMK